MSLKFYFVIFIAYSAIAYPARNVKAAYDRKHCIQLNPAAELEIQSIVNKIGNFLNELAQKHYDFDIRLIKIDLEKHSDGEDEEKDTRLKVTVNDCVDDGIADGDIEKDENKKPAESASVEEANDAKENPMKVPKVVRLQFGEEGQKIVEEHERMRGKTSPLLVYLQEGNFTAFLNK